MPSIDIKWRWSILDSKLSWKGAIDRDDPVIVGEFFPQ
jgi:hypothetical protein